MGHGAADLSRLEVGDDNNLLANHVFRGIRLGDAGNNLADLTAHVNLGAKQLVRSGDFFTRFHRTNLEVDFEEIVKFDQGNTFRYHLWRRGLAFGNRRTS